MRWVGWLYAPIEYLPATAKIRNDARGGIVDGIPVFRKIPHGFFDAPLLVVFNPGILQPATFMTMKAPMGF